MEEIKFDEISTQTSEETFIKIILEKVNVDSYKTFFLNGVWGSGKTTFLMKVEERSQKTKFINLKLWEVQDERSVIALAFSLLHPFQNYVMLLLILIAVVISIVMTPAINLGLSAYFPNLIITLGSIVALFVTVYQFLRVKSDSLYIRLIPYFLKDKVLIIDDFDRISVERQEEAYKLFNILHGKLPIIFIGDYQKISKTDNESGKYLQKIIDRRLELPSVLNAKNIWENYLNKLSIEFQIKSSIFSIIKSDNRTLRELKQFCDLLNYELFTRSKREFVDVEQLITIVYIFLFYPKYYLELRDFGTLLLNDDIKELRTAASSYEPRKRKKTIKELFYEILIDYNDKVYPRKFKDNKGIYYVDEYVNNLSLKEAQEIFSDKNKLERILKNNGNEDFLSYLTTEYSKFQNPTMDDFKQDYNEKRTIFEANRNLIEKLSFEAIKQDNRNKIIDFVIFELWKRIDFESQEDVKNTEAYKKLIQKAKQEHDFIGNEMKKLKNEIEYKKWESYTQEFSLSEKIKFHIDYRFGGQYIIPLLTDLSLKMMERKTDLKLEKHKEYIYYLATRTFDNYRENKYHIKELIKDLSDTEFIKFWMLMGMVSENEIKTYYLDFDTGARTDISDIYNENKDRFELIGNRRGTFFEIIKQ